jgi:hypothetical protein
MLLYALPPQDESSSAASLSHSQNLRHGTKPTKPKRESKGKRAMARLALGNSPRQNPCAQCGTPIAAPDWVESFPGHTSYLWCCRACDYRFEAVAYFADQKSEPEPIAA